MTSPRSFPVSAGSRLFQRYVLSLASWLVGSLVVRVGGGAGWFPHGVEVAIAVASVVPLALTALQFRRLLARELDELLQRVVLEGLAFALMVYLPLAALVLNLRSAGVPLPRLDPPDILLTLLVLVGLGIQLAWRRYR